MHRAAVAMTPPPPGHHNSSSTAASDNKQNLEFTQDKINVRLVLIPCLVFISECLDNKLKKMDIKKHLINLYKEEEIKNSITLAKSFLRKSIRAKRKVSYEQDLESLTMTAICKQLIDLVKLMKNDNSVKFAPYNSIVSSSSSSTAATTSGNSKEITENTTNTSKCAASTD